MNKIPNIPQKPGSWVSIYYRPIENKITANMTPIIGTTTVNAPNAGYASLCVSPAIERIVVTT